MTETAATRETPEPTAPPGSRPPLEPLDEDFESVLCVVAHPDDIEYGTAAAVDRWVKAGKTVTYLLATEGEAGIDTIPPEQAGPLRAQEERDGAREVGVDVVEFLGYQDGVLEYSTALRRDIARVIRQRRPEVVTTGSYEEVFVAGRTNQADHRVVGLATLDAVRDAANRWVFRDQIEREGLQPWAGVKAVLMTGSAHATHYVDVADNVEPAVASLEAHRVYNANLSADWPQPRELVTMILQFGGKAAGVDYAVAFRRFVV
ncbi:MAG: PIG-L deacetylase family protein [Dermatophilaceae bacterium]